MLVFSAVTFCNSWCFVGAAKKKKTSMDFFQVSYSCVYMHAYKYIQVSVTLHTLLAIKTSWGLKVSWLASCFPWLRHCLVPVHLHAAEKHLELCVSMYNLDKIEIFLAPSPSQFIKIVLVMQLTLQHLTYGDRTSHIFLPNAHHSELNSSWLVLSTSMRQRLSPWEECKLPKNVLSSVGACPLARAKQCSAQDSKRAFFSPPSRALLLKKGRWGMQAPAYWGCPHRTATGAKQGAPLPVPLFIWWSPGACGVLCAAVTSPWYHW